MKKAFDPDLFVARWYAEYAGPEDMPAFATDALEAGYDGPSVRRLAGMIKPASREVGGLFTEALREIGTVTIHSKEQAIFFLSRMIAKDIVENRIEPIPGAEILARYAMMLQYPESLVNFFQFSEMPHWGEYAPESKKLAADIVSEARRLLSSAPE